MDQPNPDEADLGIPTTAAAAGSAAAGIRDLVGSAAQDLAMHLESLAGIDQAALADQATRYEHIHRHLQDVLSQVER